MGNRIFVAVVLLLWATTMSWLVFAKILPPFFSGEPPKQARCINPTLSAGRSSATANRSAMRSAKPFPEHNLRLKC